MKLIRLHSKEMEKFYDRFVPCKKRVQERVRKIIEDVRSYGDEAVVKYTKRFDKVKIAPSKLRVTEVETSAAFGDVSPSFTQLLSQVSENITRFYKRELNKSWKIKDNDGVVLGEKIAPIASVGIYIPAGTAPLISTVYMTVSPAKIAGVKNIIITTPPNDEGYVNPYILAVASLLKVDAVYKIGGAQAIAAMAFGTKTIPRVDKIIGPGNEYVTEAKRQVFGYCDIDMIAGPTELVIIANKYANVDYVIADLSAQSEHVGGISILVTSSKSLAKAVKTKVSRGYIVLVKNLNEAALVTNCIAPEHLEIMVKNPTALLKKIDNAGAIFIGPYSPTAVGDYIAGPSHVLPTGGTARFFSGLGVEDFLKKSHIIAYSKKALEKYQDQLEKIANVEGLSKHLDSVKVRLK